MFQQISFVKPQQEDEELCDVKPESPGPAAAAIGLSGEEAQSFYEALLGIPSSSYPPVAVGSSVGPPNGKQQPAPLAAVDSSDDDDDADDNNNDDGVAAATSGLSRRNRKASPKDLLLAAQNGQFKDLRRILHSKVLDVDLQDAFGWTALHCAAYEGHLSCVRLLLKFGATREVRDNKGRTALELARRRKKDKVYHVIKTFGTDLHEPGDLGQRPSDGSAAALEIVRCELCGVDFDSDKKEAHECSIVHRAVEPAAGDPMYGISEANVGFRMLEQMGWERERGLGVEGQGRKFPVKTQLKRDREGLGHSVKPSKVTHFDPHDTRAVERAALLKRSKNNNNDDNNNNKSNSSMPKQTHKKSCDRNLERDFRRAFY